MKRILVYFSIFVLLGNTEAQNESLLYSFFSAGHTYGNPMSPQYGLHPPFVSYFPKIEDYPDMELGFLTGDVVFHSTATYWDTAQIDIDKLNMPVYIAAGNHDMGPEFVSRYEYYFSFINNNDLFIVLTPGLGGWNIKDEQLEFLKNTLDSNYAQVSNIFIFLHELIWWAPDNEYQNVIINYAAYYPGSTNFDSVVKPLLLSYPNNITLYAGDVGATAHVSPFMYHHFDNITLIASGMGGGVQDNIIVTEVYTDSVYYNLIALNSDDPKALGELKDFSIHTFVDQIESDQIRVYPNPCNRYFMVSNGAPADLEMSIFNVYGQLVLSKQVSMNSVEKIAIPTLSPGFYFLRFTGKAVFFEQKMIVR